MHKGSKVNFYLIWAAASTNLCLTTNLDISVCCRCYKILILSDLQQSEISYDKLQVCRKMRFNYNKCKIYHLRDKCIKLRLKGILSKNQMITNHKSYKYYYQENKKTSFKLRFLQGYQIKIPNSCSNSKVKKSLALTHINIFMGIFNINYLKISSNPIFYVTKWWIIIFLMMVINMPKWKNSWILK